MFKERYGGSGLPVTTSIRSYWKPGLGRRTIRKTPAHTHKTMADNDLQEQLEKKVRAAELVDIPVAEEQQEDFGEIAEMVARGDASLNEVEDKVVEWVNERVDIPFVPEFMEDKIFSLVSSLLRKAALEAAKSMV